MRILSIDEIKANIKIPKIITMQEEGFKLYSKGKVNVPPVGYIDYKNPTGFYHIKYGKIDDDSYMVVKIAGSSNSKPLSGLMIAFSTITGKPEAILLDDGYLTHLRTAVAGLICAKYLAPKSISAIGVLGTGTQARMQVEILKNLTNCRIIYVWGRSIENASSYKKDMEKAGFKVNIVHEPNQVTKHCNLIITTTSSRKPLININDLQFGTHITAMGADTIGKQELDPNLFNKFDIIVADSIKQCIDHGEIRDAYNKKLIGCNDIVELGRVIENPLKLARNCQSQITVADLTGVAIQDIQIVKSILN